MSNKFAIALIFILGLIVYLYGLASQEVVMICVRFGLFVSEMNQYGISFFPTLYSFPYTDYPSTGMIMMYFASCFGKYINMFTLALPSAVMGSLTLEIIYLIGLRQSKIFAWHAVLLTLMSLGYTFNTRRPCLDSYVVLVSAFSFYLIYTADIDKRHRRLLVLPLCLIFGFLFRGPIGFVIPAAIILVYYIVNLDLKGALLTFALSGILGFLCLVGISYLCLEQGGGLFLEAFLNDQIFGRIATQKYALYYFVEGPIIFYITLPLSFIMIVIYFKKIFLTRTAKLNQSEKLLRNLTCWLLTVLVVMSIPGCKYGKYIMPAIPAAALISAFLFINYDNSKVCDYARKVFLLVAKIAPFFMPIIFIVLLILFTSNTLNHPIEGFIFFLLLSLANIYLLKTKFDKNSKNSLHIFIVALLFVGFQIFVLEPIKEHRESSKVFVLEVETKKEKNAKVAFIDIGPDSEDLKYMWNIPAGNRYIPEFISSKESVPDFYDGATTSFYAKDSTSKSAITQSFVKLALNLFPTIHTYLKPELPYSISFNYLVYPINRLNELPLNTVYITRHEVYQTLILPKMKDNTEIIATGSLANTNCLAFKRVK